MCAAAVVSRWSLQGISDFWQKVTSQTKRQLRENWDDREGLALLDIVLPQTTVIAGRSNDYAMTIEKRGKEVKRPAKNNYYLYKAVLLALFHLYFCIGMCVPPLASILPGKLVGSLACIRLFALTRWEMHRLQPPLA